MMGSLVVVGIPAPRTGVPVVKQTDWRRTAAPAILAKHFSINYSEMPKVSENNRLDVYRMIADPNRRKILELLREGERPVQALQPHIPITLGALSQHLQLLHRSGLVSRTRRGKQRIYRLEAHNLQEIDQWLDRFRTFWESRLDRLGLYLDKKSQ